MMNKTITLHIPMERTVRDQLEAKAKRLGFTSAQAYIRVWAKAEVDDRKLDLGDWEDWGEPSPKAVARFQKMAAEIRAQRKAGTLRSAHSVAELMAQLKK